MPRGVGSGLCGLGGSGEGGGLRLAAMTEQTPETSGEAATGTGEAGIADGPLVVTTPLDPGAITKRLSAMSKKGKLPGYQAGGGRGDLFTVDAFGAPFDAQLGARAESGEGGTRLTLERRMPWKGPLAFAVLLVFCVWPGGPLTDSFLKTYLGFYRGWVESGLALWMWYYPLTAPFVPLSAWQVWKKTKTSTWASAVEAAEKLAGALDGSVERA